MNSIKRHATKPSPVLEQFAKEFPRCWLCGTTALHAFPAKIEIHHMVRGSHRKKAREDRCVLVAACQKCHQQRLDSMPIVRQLALKQMHDPEHYDRVRVNTLRCRAPEAITESEVWAARLELTRLAEENGGYPFPRWRP